MTELNIKKKVNQFLSDRKYSNNLIEILSCLDEPNKVKPNVVLEIQRLFTEILKKRTMFIDPNFDNTKNSATEVKYIHWLRDCYKQCFSKLVDVLSTGETDTQLQALLTFMHLIQEEGKYQINPSKQFPEEKLTLLLKYIILSPFCSIFTKVFQQYVIFVDIIFYTFKSISFLVSNDNFLLKEDVIMNAINFLKEIPLPSNKEKIFSTESKKDENVLFCNQRMQFELKDFCLYATKIWNALACYKNHNSVTMKELLILLIDKLMHYHSNPILITDFLMNALKFEGPIAVLSLQGMVNLVRQYNLEYPNIYDKLYNLLEPNIFYTKYKARLFYLTDLLMMSTHLPEILVASFIKRLSRLCLTAPPQDIAIMIYLIGNLILRHKGLVTLFQKDNTFILESDPFDEKEVNPYNTNALKSSLWEIKILQNHPLYTVNVPARFINNPLPSVEWDLAKYLEVTYNEIFTKENKKKQKNISTNFEKPNSMFQPNTNLIFDHFSFV